ncbi:MAG: universal stress protein, partial [Bacteroidota bacterium]
MLQIRRILFPTDFSDCAESAYRHASYLANRFGAELHVLHVVEEGRDDPGDWVADLSITPLDIAIDLDLPVESPAEEMPPARFVSVTETAPHAGPAILRYADARGIDLIVMGTHGRRGMRRFVMGSVAEEVMQTAPCPVFTIGGGKACREAWTIRHVLAPVDFSEHARASARHAAALAEAYGASLTLVTVVDMAMLPTGSAPYLDIYHVPTDDLEARARRLLNEQAASLRREFPALPLISTHVQIGRPASAIVEVAEEVMADCLVMGSHGRTGMERLLMGSVSGEVVRSAPCPVFVVKSFGRKLLPLPEPVASEPVASEPVASEPVASEPVASEPVAS